MAGYVRQSTILDDGVVDASLFNDEYNTLVTAFSNSTGHAHNGSAGEGPVIGLIGDTGVIVPLNKVDIDTPSNSIRFWVDVSDVSVHQLSIEDGVVKPITDSDIDLGTSALRFSTAYLDSLDLSGDITVGGTVDGRDVATDGTKLDGIETGATADQSNAEIKSAYEANSDTNAFTDADHTKLDGIESGATADQSNAEIKVAYEANSNTNAFTDTEQTKLSGIESGATADQSNAEIKVAYEANSNTNAFTDTEQTKLSGISTGAEVNPSVVGQSEAEDGTATTERIWTAERVNQAIAAQTGTKTTVVRTSSAFKSSTTVSNDNQLSTSLTAGDIYRVELFLRAHNDGAGPGIKLKLNTSGAHTTMGLNVISGGETYEMHNQYGRDYAGDAGTNEVGFSLPNQIGRNIIITGTIRCTTSTTLTLQWGQNVSAGDDCYLLAGSYLRTEKIN